MGKVKVFENSSKYRIASVHSSPPHPLIFLPRLIHPTNFPFFYYLLFLPEPFSNTHRFSRFISIGFFPSCTNRLIIKILTFCCIQFLIEHLNRVKFIFLHDRRKPLFYIIDLYIIPSISCCNSFRLPPLKIPAHSDSSFFSLSRFFSRSKIALFCSKPAFNFFQAGIFRCEYGGLWLRRSFRLTLCI